MGSWPFTAMPTATAAAAAVRGGEVSSLELVEQCLSAIDAMDERLHAFVHVDPDGARRRAREVDAAVAEGRAPGPLTGVPFGVKDLEDAAGMPTARGSRWFVGGPAARRDDLHVARLRDAGAIPIGKTATPEFGSFAFTSSVVSGVTRNPWDPSRTPGGSSGGSAAAVASGMVPFCTASDGGGSIRGPAAFTGLPGLRPVYGRVPTFGSTHVAQTAVNFALATTVGDTALLLDVCSGPDRRDRTCMPPSTVVYADAAESLPVDGLRCAFSLDLGFGTVDDEIAAMTQRAYADLVAACGLREAEVPVELDDYFDTYVKIEGVDRFVDLPPSLWPDRADELDPSLLAGWTSGARARLPQLAEVFTARRRLEHQVAELFDRFDVLVTPTTSVRAFVAEGPLPDRINATPVHPFVGVAQPVLASLCNLPAMSVPVGLTTDGLPVGMQIVAGQHREDVCLRLARLFELARPWPRHAPRC